MRLLHVSDQSTQNQSDELVPRGQPRRDIDLDIAPLCFWERRDQGGYRYPVQRSDFCLIGFEEGLDSFEGIVMGILLVAGLLEAISAIFAETLKPEKRSEIEILPFRAIRLTERTQDHQQPLPQTRCDLPIVQSSHTEVLLVRQIQSNLFPRFTAKGT
jgi:hypothetical protein